MKKFVALLLAMLLVLVNVAVLADGPDASDIEGKVEEITMRGNLTPSASTPAVQKEYTIDSDLAYEETLNFTVACTEAPTGVATTTAPKITIGTENNAYTYAVGTVESDMIPITFPTYTVAGTYTYTINETPGTVQGVTYTDKTVNVKVYVEYKNGVLTPTANVWVGTTEVEKQKSDKITNKMEVKDLKVTKKLEGNLADPNKPFTIEVTFTKTAGKTVKTPITVTTVTDGGTADKEQITAAALNEESQKVTLTLKGDQYVTFENIPYGVTYSVTETGIDRLTDETKDPNKPNSYKVTGEVSNATIGADTTDVEVKNIKNFDVPTGIALDSVPYILILAVALFGVITLAARRREEY